MAPPKKQSEPDVQLRDYAAETIQQLLRRTSQYTEALVSLLTTQELQTITSQAKHPGGAVAIAAVIYRARQRLASEEAEFHHATINTTVPLPPSAFQRQCTGVDGPAIRQVARPRTAD